MWFFIEWFVCVCVCTHLSLFIVRVGVNECMDTQMCIFLGRKEFKVKILPQTGSTLVYETGSLIGIWSSQIRIGCLVRELRNPPVCVFSARIMATFIFRWALSGFVLWDKPFLPDLSCKFQVNFVCTSLVSFAFILIHPQLFPFYLIMHKNWMFTWSTDFQISFFYKALITQYDYRLICL